MVDIPTDNHIRSMLDTVEPAYLPGVTIAGYDLYARQPLIEQIPDEDMNFLFVCNKRFDDLLLF